MPYVDGFVLPVMDKKDSPFDPKRMIYGGFEVLVAA
jgi:uncharacterized protein YbaA (DUF1428 family)